MIFIGAFLLFQIEPTVGKIITPLYGGAASVWLICLLFFQLVVLIGYTLTFAITRLPVKAQLILYPLIICVSVFCFRTIAGGIDQPSDINHPVFGVLSLLIGYFAIPCVLLSTISGMLQVWFELAQFGKPYPLYSVSNLGSIGALLSYPLLVEPYIGVSRLFSIWSVAYVSLAFLISFCSLIVWSHLSGSRVSDWSSRATDQPSVRVRFKEVLAWIFFSTMGSAILLTYSEHITVDISPIPLLWVLPLSMYLFTFVLAFANSRLYPRQFLLLTWMPLGALEPFCDNGLLSVVINLILLFELCLICHGELAANKPVLAKLPLFYLAIAIGGVLGGLSISVIAPFLFNFPAERLLIVGIMAAFTLNELVIKKLKQGPAKKKFLAPASVTALLLSLGLACLAVEFHSPVVYRARNFYGSVSVVKEGDSLVFYHGRVNHGQQYLDPAKAGLPAGPYYSIPTTLISEYIRDQKSNSAISIGAVGLGVGVCSVYAHPEDAITFYELDPKVKEIAERFFTYLSNCRAHKNILIGDGRILLAKQPPQNYDLVIIDVFNGDAIPCHLLTKQAMQIYLKHLNSDGLLLFHISNRFVDLAPILGNICKELDLYGCQLTFNQDVRYLVISKEKKEIDQLVRFDLAHRTQYPGLTINEIPVRPKLGIWTDDFTNLVSVFKF